MSSSKVRALFERVEVKDVEYLLFLLLDKKGKVVSRDCGFTTLDLDTDIIF